MPPRPVADHRFPTLRFLTITLLLAVVIPTLIAYMLAVRPIQNDQRITRNDQRIDQLEQRVDQLETDVSLLRE